MLSTWAFSKVGVSFRKFAPFRLPLNAMFANMSVKCADRKMAREWSTSQTPVAQLKGGRGGNARNLSKFLKFVRLLSNVLSFRHCTKKS